MPSKPYAFSPVLMLSRALLLLFIWSANDANAAPYLPKSDAQILEKLPFKANDPIAKEMAQMRGQLQRNPNNLDIAVRLARRYYSLVAEEGDPRYLGYAQAALGPWWPLTQPPVSVLVLRASLAQFRHDFSSALRDLGQALERDPTNGQARVLRATIYIVQAHYAQARQDCQALHNVSSELIATGCEAMVDGLTGNAAMALAKLQTVLDRTPNAPPGEKLWVLLRLAEMAQRLGQNEIAENQFKQAISLGIQDTFLLAAYADFLLKQNRPAEVDIMLKEKLRSDTLLLRLVLAEYRLNKSSAKEKEATLEARYVAAQLRGDTVHQQEEAQFELKIKHNPKRALALAQENWKVQLEPRDAQIFLDSALALKNAAAAAPVLRWMEESHIEDRALQSTAQQLKAL
jgi:Tfp pilus assembly protein PilF